MAPPPPLFMYLKQILGVSLLFLLLFVSVSESHFQSTQLSRGRRRMLEAENEDPPSLKKKSTAQSQSLKNQTKLIKPKILLNKNQSKTIQNQSINLSSKNQTKKAIQSAINVSPKNQTKKAIIQSGTKNQTKLAKVGSSKTTSTSIVADSGLKKLNSTSKISKQLNSTSKSSNPTKTKTTPVSSTKSLDLTKSIGAKNKTTKETKASNKPEKNPKKSSEQKPKKTTIKASWIESDDDEDDFVSDLKDLPNKFQQSLIPDLERISTTSRAYITRANKEITKGFKPYVGNRYAPSIAAVLSCAFALIPLVLVSLIFTKIKAYFSLQKLLIFVQIYLSIYFSILCVSSLVTGLEPLKFFYATSQSTYICIQLLQTLGYVFYLLLLLMHLVLVFSTECGLGSRFLGLAQTMLGFAMGLHYYVTVFHRVVLRQPPKTNWKIHGIYATCFLLICVFAGADRRKKAYLQDGGEEGKKN